MRQVSNCHWNNYTRDQRPESNPLLPLDKRKICSSNDREERVGSKSHVFNSHSPKRNFKWIGSLKETEDGGILKAPTAIGTYMWKQRHESRLLLSLDKRILDGSVRPMTLKKRLNRSHISNSHSLKNLKWMSSLKESENGRYWDNCV